MKRLLLLILTMYFAIPVIASGTQFRITGKITDNSGAPIAYATVSAYRDTLLVNAVAADEAGIYSLTVTDKGRYIIRVSAIGYKDAEKETEVSGTMTDAGTMIMEQGVDIDEVVVEVHKKIITSDAEKMTYSVENDPQASTSTLEEIIRKIPQLSIDAEGNVLLNGQSDYRILLNGHKASSLSNNFKEIIRSMPASQIKKIEVITDPSTKYDAEGVGGILNIVTVKKNSFDGYNGSINAGTEQADGEFYNTSANISLQTGKFAIGASGYFSDFTSRDSESASEQTNIGITDESDPIGSIKERGIQSYKGTNYGFTLDMSYQPDTLNLITINSSLWVGRSNNFNDSATEVFDPAGKPMYSYLNSAANGFKYTGGTVGLNYEHTFGKEEHTLTISDEINIDPDDFYNDRYIYWSDGRSTASFVKEPTGSLENTFQIDYNNPINERHRIEAGIKHIYRNDKIFETYTYDGSDGRPDRISDMYYRQHILGIYAGYGFIFTKWSGRLGFRMERTWNDADVESTDQGNYSFQNRMFNVIPYANITFTPKEGHNLSFSYTQRLERPSIGSLSPGVDNSDPVSISYGNPDLRSAVFNSLSLKYSYHNMKWNTTFALTNFISNNYITSYSFVDPSGIMHNTYSNDVHTRAYGFNGSLSYRPSTKLNISFSYRGNYSKYDFAEMGIHSERFSFGENMNVDLAAWKDARIMLGESYYTGSIYLTYKSSYNYNYYIGIKQKFFKQKLELAVTVYNPFNKNRTYTSDNVSPSYIQHMCTIRPFRSIGIRINYRFGKQEIRVKKTSRSIENDDMQSASKGGSK